MKKKKNDDFLMSPTVDYCFKELLAYPEVRKGFVAAILGKNPEEIEETILMPTILSKDTENGKYGILDVRVCMKMVHRWIWKCRLRHSNSGTIG